MRKLIAAAGGLCLLIAPVASATLIGDDVGYEITITFANGDSVTASGTTTVGNGVEVDPLIPTAPYLALDVDASSFELVYDDAVNRAIAKLQFSLTDLDWTDQVGQVIGATFVTDDFGAATTSVATTFTSVSIVVEEDPFFVWGIGDRLVVAIEAVHELPEILSIVDVENDQGRSVRATWNRSSYDSADSSYTVVDYGIWRRIDSAPGTLSEPPAAFLRMFPPGDWDFVTSVPARGEDVYNVVVPTLCDSTIADGQCYSVFVVSANTPDPLVFFDSEPDSGYSVDNLAPAAPMNLMFDTPTALLWDEAHEKDFDHFAVYGSFSPNFDMTAVQLGFTVDPMFDVTSHTFPYFHVTAKDFSGNEGPAGTVGDDAVGATETLPAPTTFSLKAPRPNPVVGATTVDFDLPRRQSVQLRVYDATGRLVQVLSQGSRPAGRHSVRWDARDGSGRRVATGVYFLRMEAGDFSSSRRLVVLR